MEDIREFLIDKIGERYIVDEILEMKYRMEHREKFKNCLIRIKRMVYDFMEEERDSFTFYVTKDGYKSRNYTHRNDFLVISRSDRLTYIPLITSEIKSRFSIDYIYGIY